MAYNFKNSVGLSSKAVKSESPERRLEQVEPAQLETSSRDTSHSTVERASVCVSSSCARGDTFASELPDEGGSEIRVSEHFTKRRNKWPHSTRQQCCHEDNVSCEVADIDVDISENKGVVKTKLFISKLPKVCYVYEHIDGRVTKHKDLTGIGLSNQVDHSELQLNGSHGEVTEGDDMSVVIGGDGKTNLADLERSRREADNHRHSSNASAAGQRKKKPKKQKIIPLGITPSVCTSSSNEEQSTPKLFVIRVVPYVVKLGAHHYTVYTDFGDTKMTLRLLPESLGMNLDLDTIGHGMVLSNVIKENYGWYSTSTNTEKGKTLVAASAFQLEQIRSIKIDDKWTDYREGIIFMPLLSKLRQEFRNAKGDGPISQSLAAAIKNVTASSKNSVEPALPTELRAWFNEVCDFTETAYKLHVMESHAQSNVANNMFLPRVIAGHTEMRIRTGVVNRVNTVDVPYEQLMTPYAIKPNITYSVRGNGVNVVLSPFSWFTQHPWKIKPTRQVEEVYSEGRATHKWVTLTDTIRYSPSVNNLYGAMSRIFKARDGEEEFQKNQSLLCTALRHKFGQSHLWSRLNVSFATTTIDDTLLYVVNKYPYIVGDCVDGSASTDDDSASLLGGNLQQLWTLASKRYNFLIDAVSYLHTQVQPVLSECVVDLMHNSLVSMQVAAYTLFTSCHIPLLWRTQYAAEPHIKKLERQKMVAETVVDGTGCLVSSVGVNVKDEIAKNGGKMPRAFVSYGSGVMCAPTLAITLKQRLNGYHYFNIGDIELCVICYSTPKSSELEILFETLVTARRRNNNFLCVAIYSDDSCYSGIVNGIPFGFNVDISSCDSSNGPPIFFIVASLMSKLDPTYAELLLEQCSKPMKVKHPTTPELSLKITLPTAFEGSGTVLTSLLNFVASFLIALMVANQLYLNPPHDVDDVSKQIVSGALLVGHKVTVATIEEEGVLEPSRFQFLKISPMMCRHKDTGEVRLIPVKNIGSIIKGFGQLKEDMQAYQLSLDNATFNLMTYEQRMNCYLGAVVAGYRNEPASPILTALRTRFSTTTGVLKPEFAKVTSDCDYSMYEVLESELNARYGVLDYQIVCYNLLDLRLGDNLQADPVLQRIMHVDYEYVIPSKEVNFSMDTMENDFSNTKGNSLTETDCHQFPDMVPGLLSKAK